MTIEGIGFTVDTQSRPNEDSFDCKLIKSDLLIAAIADGVGGNVGGSIASAIAIEMIIKELQQSPNSEFVPIFEKIVNKFIDVTKENPLVVDMATTLTVCIVSDGFVRFAHVGDSRLYHLRSNGIIQKTKDQTEVAILVDQGILSPRKAKHYPRRSVLVSALSSHADYDLTEGAFELEKFDRLIMLTDGAYKELTKRELRDESVSTKNIGKLSKNLQEDLIKKAPSDDATMILIEYS
jgi:protein phosphatase